MKNKQSKKSGGVLGLVTSQEKKAGSAGSKSQKSDPSSILRLISQCEALISMLKGGDGDGDIISDLLITLAELKITLLYLFKKKQRKLIDLHWEQMREENARILKKTHEKIEEFNKQQEKKSGPSKFK
ncbi:hypothetical protein KKC59_04200 [bacterium]|nr:hypothetical protein [bacterium]